jgi:beta-lactamase superfamily II metal-dependent hydrolase
MIRFFLIFLLGLSGLSASLTRPPIEAAGPDKTLDIYFVDVEGGAATLIVTPAGESILVDSGWPREDGRDAKRIHSVATQVAKLTQIDHYVTTHWHTDHYGGIGRLSELMPVKQFYHHGIPERLSEDPQGFPVLMAAYQKASRGKSRVLRPGDEIPLASGKAAGRPALRLRCIAAHGDVLPEDASAPANPLCKDSQAKPEDTTDNARSVSLLLTFGPFKFLDCGDLTWNVEKKLVCPTNKIGTVDVYQVNHHGMALSNNPVLVRSVRPRVAIINNGPKKGGDAPVYALLHGLPDIEAVYALHRNVRTTDRDNPPPEFIANLKEDCQGEFIKLSVDPTGKRYTVGIGSKGPARSYIPR